MNEIILEYLNTIDIKSYKGVAVIGSYAMNTEKKWSDIDLIFLVDNKRPTDIVLFNGKYFTLSYHTEEDLRTYLTDTMKMIKGIHPLREMKILFDPDRSLEKLKEAFENHTPTSVDREHSLYASKREYISYMEEAQKALQGLIDKHHGKMICGLYGLTYGMFSVVLLREHLYLESENDFYDTVMNHLDAKDPVKDLAPHAFAIDPTTLEDQVEAGLEMFMHIGNSLMKVFSDEEKSYVLKLMHEIIKEV